MLKFDKVATKNLGACFFGTWCKFMLHHQSHTTS